MNASTFYHWWGQMFENVTILIGDRIDELLWEEMKIKFL